MIKKQQNYLVNLRGLIFQEKTMNKRIDTRKIKSQLSLKDYSNIMDSLGIPLYSKGESQWIYFTGDKNIIATHGSPKLYFYPDNKIYVSYTSGCTYDIISLTQKRLSLLKQPSSFMDAINFILSVVDLKIDSIQRINKPHICNWEDGLGKFIRLRHGESILTPYDDSILDQLETRFYQGWIDEGISIDTMLKYEIKWYKRTSQIVIPCRERMGQLIGIRCRNINPDRAAHAKYMPLTLLDGKDYRFNTNDTFYGISHNWEVIERTGHVILVEGEKSVLKADSFMGRDNNVLALYGSQIGMTRRNQLVKMGVNHVTLALDSDFHEVGDEEYNKFEKKVLALAKLFKGWAKVDVVYNNIGLDAYKASPFDFDEATYNLLWENREVVE